ncbi:MAG: VOC family protein [Minwuiales bacterium]|nr:VOC family protein [Minwuiales bacterium]
MTNDLGGPPDGGWASLVPELAVTDLEASLAFWLDLLGFGIAYRRPAEKFVYLQCQGAQVMLCERNGRYETGRMQPPFGQGAMFQIYLDSIDPILAALDAADWPLYEPPAETWYGVGDEETGLRKFFVQDPDGYLLMIGERLGGRPAL